MAILRRFVDYPRFSLNVFRNDRPTNCPWTTPSFYLSLAELVELVTIDESFRDRPASFQLVISIENI